MLLDKCQQEEYLHSLPNKRFKELEYLAFEGGGGKGIVYLGVIQALEEGGVLPISKNRLLNGQCKIKGLSGASSGSITSFLLAIGCTAKEIEKDFIETDSKGKSVFEKFLSEPNPGVFKAVKTVGGITKLGYGVDEINILNLKKILAGKGSFNRLSTKFYEDKSEAIKAGNKIYQKIMPIVNTILNTLASPLLSVIVGSQFSKVMIDYKGKNMLEKVKANLFNLYYKREKNKLAYSLLFDRGFFTGFQVRDYFIKKIEDKVKISKSGDKITFKDLYQYNKIKLVIVGTNVSKGNQKFFSADYTPDFPVVEAIALSMSFPLAFKPLFVDAIVDFSKSKEYNEAYQGFYSDGGQMVNIPIHVFNYEGSDEDPNNTIVPIKSSVMAFGNIAGYNPKEKVLEILIDSEYQKYLKSLKLTDYDSFIAIFKALKEIDKNDESCGLPSILKKEYSEKQFIIALTTHLDKILGAYSFNPEFGQFRVLSEYKHYLQCYTYDVGLFDFNPQENLRKFVVNKAKQRVLKYFYT